MAQVDARLVVAMEAKLDKLEKQMRQAGQMADKAVSDIEGRFARANPQAAFLTSFVKGLVGAEAIRRLSEALIEANKELGQIGETARRVGVDLARFQELRIGAALQGVGGKEFDKGIEGLAEKLNDSLHTETKLGELFAANNIKMKDRTGAVISTNDALGQIANLVANAATEFDKIKIAEAAGLTREWVPLLEQGAAGIARMAEEGRNTGGVLDKEVVAKAKEFDEAWTAAWASFSANAKAYIADILPDLHRLTKEAGSFWAAMKHAGANAKGLFEEATREPGSPISPNLARTRREFAPKSEDAVFGREADRARGFSGIGTAGPPRQTDVKSLYAKRGGGGGGGGMSEAEKAEERLSRYTDQLKRQGDVLAAEISTFGQSNAVRKAAIEIAKAAVDLEKLDAATRAEKTEAIRKEVSENERKREVLAQMQGALEASRSAAQAFTDALLDIALEGKNAGEVLQSLGKSMLRSLASGALAGSGPFAGWMGTKESGGLLGSLLGPLFGGFRAGGGPVAAGRAYVVGERAPELFVPSTPGAIYPALPRGGAPAAGGVQVTQHIYANSEQTVQQAAYLGALRATQMSAAGFAARQQDMARRA